MNRKRFSILIIIIVGLSGYIIFSCTPHSVPPPLPVLPVPSEKQLAWQELEMYAFVHFTTNTFTNKEWGFGNESPEVFNPSQLDVNQWVKTIKDAGMKALILTCKHHDGFCLWPSAYTNIYTIGSQFHHHEWHGLLFWDLIQPFFMFIVGVGMYLSYMHRTERGDNYNVILKHVLVRSLLLL